MGMVCESGQAGASEIEITEDMIKAGGSAIMAHFEAWEHEVKIPIGPYSAQNVAISAFKAMIAVSGARP
jgi:hypothetical protein